MNFKTPYAFSSVLRHNACVFHVSLHSRFFIVLDAFRVFLGWGHNACISHVYLYCLRHLTHFPLYGVTMHVFSRVSASFKTSFAFSSVLGHNACISHVYLYRLRPPYKIPYDWRQNPSVFHLSLHSHFFIV